MNRELLETVAGLPKVMPHMEVPIQAGNDVVLKNMKRGYTADDYRRLVGQIREIIPGCSIATDIIVGFPGETDEQFRDTYDLLVELKLDVAHLARYSSRAKGRLPRAFWATMSRRAQNGSVFAPLRSYRKVSPVKSTGVILAEQLKYYLRKKCVTVGEDERRPINWFLWKRRKICVGRCDRASITWTGPWSMQGVLSKEPMPSPALEPVMITSPSH